MKAGDLVNHIMKRGYGIGIIVSAQSKPYSLRLNTVYNVIWAPTGTVGSAWDYDLKVISEGR